jgi:hypothetical protein
MIRDEATTLFVYGSLLDPLRRDSIIRRQPSTVPAILRDYRLGRARYFYICKHAGSKTVGLLLLHLTESDFETFDRYEEVPAPVPA